MDRLQQEVMDLIVIAGMMAGIFILGSAVAGILARVGMWIMGGCSDEI